MKLWLIGMMGTGKSSAGRLAAASLEVPFHDSDQLVVERTDCTVAELWAQRGEAVFREAEKAAIRELAGREGIISTGGGAVLDPDSRALMIGTKVIWLQAPPGVLAQRLAGTGDRPGLASAGEDEGRFLAEMLEVRTPVYERLATHRIDTEGLTSDAVAGMIEAIWRS